MWKPSSVVPQHRNRAIVVWVAILITALGYTVWQTTVVISKRQNPSTRVLVSNQQYQFPSVSVCLMDGSGCGYSDGSIDTCVASAVKFSSAELDGQNIDASRGQAGNCVDFDLTQVRVAEQDRETIVGSTVYIYMDWVSSDNATAETEYRAGVYVILGDHSSQGEESTMVPYSRNLFSSSDRQYETTALTIGKTYRKYLSREPITQYPVLTTSTTRFVTTPDFDLFSADSSSASTWNTTEHSAIATVFLEITQGSYSHTQVEDIEPLEIGALFGNVGGFWELLVLAWGVFFITKSRDTEPTLKARNFAKVLRRGDRKQRKRRKLDSAAAEMAGHDGPRPPGWDSSDDDGLFSGSSDSGSSEQGDGSRRYRAQHTAGSRRPMVCSLPRRVPSHSVSGSVGTSATTSNTLGQSRRSSASVADETLSAMPGAMTSRRWSGSHLASAAASKFNTFDAGFAQTRKAVFTVSGSTSGNFSNNPNGGDGGKAQTSFFPTPQVSTSRIQIHPDSEDELSQSSRSATRPAHEATNLVESGEDAGACDLELGCAGETEGRRGEA